MVFTVTSECPLHVPPCTTPLNVIATFFFRTSPLVTYVSSVPAKAKGRDGARRCVIFQMMRSFRFGGRVSA